jgi:hypothetical protein
MLKQPADVVVASEYRMDKTLKDYIDRTIKNIKEDSKEENKDQYPVIPDQDETDSKRNPYSDH